MPNDQNEPICLLCEAEDAGIATIVYNVHLSNTCTGCGLESKMYGELDITCSKCNKKILKINIG